MAASMIRGPLWMISGWGYDAADYGVSRGGLAKSWRNQTGRRVRSRLPPQAASAVSNHGFKPMLCGEPPSASAPRLCLVPSLHPGYAAVRFTPASIIPSAQTGTWCIVSAGAARISSRFVRATIDNQRGYSHASSKRCFAPAYAGDLCSSGRPCNRVRLSWRVGAGGQAPCWPQFK